MSSTHPTLPIPEEAYGLSLRFLASVHSLLDGFPHEHEALGERVRRSATAVVLHIAEGLESVSPEARARARVAARRAAAECAAALSIGCDLADRAGADPGPLERAAERVEAVVRLLVRDGAP